MYNALCSMVATWLFVKAYHVFLLWYSKHIKYLQVIMLMLRPSFVLWSFEYFIQVWALIFFIGKLHAFRGFWTNYNFSAGMSHSRYIELIHKFWTSMYFLWSCWWVLVSSCVTGSQLRILEHGEWCSLFFTFTVGSIH